MSAFVEVRSGVWVNPALVESVREVPYESVVEGEMTVVLRMASGDYISTGHETAAAAVAALSEKGMNGGRAYVVAAGRAGDEGVVPEWTSSETRTGADMNTSENNSKAPERPAEGNLAQHAWDELDRAGLFDDGTDYGGLLGRAVMELIETFEAQGHSGGSAAATIDMFRKLAQFEPLSDPTDDPDEWMKVTDGLWQSRRMPDAFSTDRGATFTRNGDDTVYSSVRTGKTP